MDAHDDDDEHGNAGVHGTVDHAMLRVKTYPRKVDRLANEQQEVHEVIDPDFCIDFAKQFRGDFLDPAPVQ
jgi:hypothetical protein